MLWALLFTSLFTMNGVQLAGIGRRHGPISTAVAAFQSDAFTRADNDPLTNSGSITWTQVGANVDAGATNTRLKTNGVVGSATYGQHVTLAQGFGTRTTAQYACAKSNGTSMVSNEAIGVCVGGTNGGTTANDVFCCRYRHTGVPNDQQGHSQAVDDTNSSADDATETQAFPFYVGAERIDATNFKCWQSTNGTTWTLRNSYVQANINTPGDVGLYILGDVFNTVPLIDQWQGGDGNPMTSGWSGTYASACGLN